MRRQNKVKFIFRNYLIFFRPTLFSRLRQPQAPRRAVGLSQSLPPAGGQRAEHRRRIYRSATVGAFNHFLSPTDDTPFPRRPR